MGSLSLPQVKETDFLSDAEQEKWMLDKVSPFISAEQPARVNKDNYKLSEYYFEHSKGKDTCFSTVVEESLSRTATDLAAGTSILQVEGSEGSCQRRVDPEIKHKQMIGKVQAMARKLGTSIGSTESALPSLKRKLDATNYTCLKRGLQQSRDYKEQCLDKLEDLKVIGEEQMQDAGELMLVMNKELKEHAEALQDALKAHEVAHIKKPPEEASVADASDAKSYSRSAPPSTS